MTADQQTNHAAALPPLARRIARVLARPYLRRRARRNEFAATVARMQADIKHLRERHTEQIERLEDIAQELVLTVEQLRSAIDERSQEQR